MAKTAEEILKEFYEKGFMKADMKVILSLVSPDTEWWIFGPPGFLCNGYYQKPEGVGSFFQNLQATLGDTHTTFQPVQYLPSVNNIVTALGLEKGTIQQKGLPITGQPFYNYWSHTAYIKNDKIWRFRANFTVIPPDSVPSPFGS